MRICEIVAPGPHLSLRICLDFLFKSASTLTRRVKGTLTPVISLTHRVKGRTLSTSLQVGIYSNPQSEGHTPIGSFFHTQSAGEHSLPLSHTRTLTLFHKVESSLIHSRVGSTLTRSLTSQSRTQSGGLTHSQSHSHTLYGGHTHAISFYLTGRRGRAQSHYQIYCSTLSEY